MKFFPTLHSRPSPSADHLAGKKIAVVGGSLGGLAAANALLRLGADVTVFEKQPTTFEKRGAVLGFVDVDLLQRIRGGAKFLRNGRHASLDEGAFFYGDVWQFLFEGLPEGCVKFGCTVATLGDANAPTIDGETFDAACIADGGWSTLRAQYVDHDKLPEYSGHQIWWASVDTAAVPGGLGSFDGEVGNTDTAVYTAAGIYDAVVLEAPKNDGSRFYACGFFVATPEAEIKRPERGENRQLAQVHDASKKGGQAWFLPFVRKMFGRHAGGDIVRFTEAAAASGKISANPVFEFAVSQAVAGRVVVLGDAAHLSTPWTAAGAHTAFLDAKALRDAFVAAGGDADSALRAYNKGAVRRAHGLLRQSRACSRRLVPARGKHAAPSPASLVAGG